MTPSIPSSPSLEQLRKQAKDLLRAVGDNDATALARAREHPDGTIVKLAEAQLVIAREHGFRSWARLKAYVDRVACHGEDLRHPFQAAAEYHEERASGLLNAVEDGLASALALVRRHHADLGAGTDAEIRDGITLPDARLVQARQHGFPSWDRFLRYLQRLRREGGEPFMLAREAIDRHDHRTLEALLERDPGLLRARGTNGNDLLQLATATCDATTVRLLLERGADPSRANDRGATPLHQAAYAGSATIARHLLDAGAPLDGFAYGDGGTPVTWALFWGNREVADLIAAVDVVPRNLRVVAALGLVEDVERLAPARGRLADGAGAHRGFYRPHTGFPPWAPSDDPQEILDEALVWAAKNGRDELLGMLVARGADLEGDPYRGTPLIWAGACGRVSTVETLLRMGADPNRRATFGGPEHGEGVTALHIVGGSGAIEVCRVLLAAGADPTLPDGLHHAPPWGFATYSCEQATARLLIDEAARTSVFSSVMVGDPERLRQALAGAPEQLDDDRYFTTPLGLATWEGALAIAELLLAAGADPRHRGKDGRSPLEIAEGRERTELAELLRRHGA